MLKLTLDKFLNVAVHHHSNVLDIYFVVKLIFYFFFLRNACNLLLLILFSIKVLFDNIACTLVFVIYLA